MMSGSKFIFNLLFWMAVPLYGMSQQTAPITADSTQTDPIPAPSVPSDTTKTDTTAVEPLPVSVGDSTGTSVAVDTLGTPPADTTVQTVAKEGQGDKTKSDTTKQKVAYNASKPGLYFTLDIGKLSSFATDFEQKTDFSVGYLFGKRIAVEVEGGIAELTPNNAFENGIYESSGTYFKGGFDYYTPLNIGARNNFMVGLRYAIASFEDNLSYEIGSELWQQFGESFERKDLSADWFELVFSSEMVMTGNLFLGWKLRVRFMNQYDEQEPLDVWAVPGYGRTFDNSVPAFNLYLKYKLGF